MSERILRVNSEIQKAISNILTYEMKNPLIKGLISVTKVDTTNDLDQCKVYISIFEEENREEVFNQIKHSAGFIRRELARAVDLRKVPFLTFYLDTSYDYGQRIEETLNKINKEN
ncbi:MAG: 30S ribosome-binding factor RbfA [Clostridiales bacterium]|nr:30S ribosome-binding factor RbfA [Clostridiales bacterium]